MAPAGPATATKQANSVHEPAKDGDSDDLYGVSDTEASKRPTAIKQQVHLDAPEVLSASVTQANELPEYPKPNPAAKQTIRVGLEGSIWAAKEAKPISSDKLNMNAGLTSSAYPVDKKSELPGQVADKVDPMKKTVARTVETKAEATKEDSGNVERTRQNEYIPPHLRTPEPRRVKVAEGTVTPQTASTSPAYFSTETLAKPEGFTPAMKEPEEDSSHLPPHLRLPKVPKAETDEEKLHRIMANQPSFSLGKGKDTYVKGTASNFSGEPTRKTKKALKLEKIMMSKGWSPPKAGPIRPEGDWYHQEEEQWEERPPHLYGAAEHVSALEAWVDDRLQQIPSQPVFTATSSAGFVDGTEIPDGELVHSSPTDEDHGTRRLTDPFTAAKGNQTAQNAIEKFQQKKQLESPKPHKYTKEEKRELREAHRQIQKYYLEMEKNNPNKPDIDIYIRRAEINDLGPITEIYNWYIENTCIALELKAMEPSQWQARMDTCRDEGFEMFVAVLKLGKGERQHSSRERVCGFVYANELGGRAHSYRFTAQIEVYVSQEYLHRGIGRCLFDRMMAIVDFNHPPSGGVEWRGPPMLNIREISRIHVEVPYFADDAAEVEAMEWKKAWLCGSKGRGRMHFQHYATQPGFGFKKGKR